MATEDISEEMQRGRNLADLQESGRNYPAKIIGSLKQRLSEAESRSGGPNFDTGGTVPEDGSYDLKSGERVTPPNSAQTAPPVNASTSQGSVRLHRDYSAVMESLTTFCDQHTPRSFTVPYLPGEMNEHISAVGKAATAVGGLTKNLVSTYHHSTGKGYGSEDGTTVGHNVQKMHNVIIPPKSEHAAEVLQKAQRYLNDISSILGKKNPAVMKSQSVLDLLKRNSASGMSLDHFFIAVVGLTNGPTKAIAQAHSGSKTGGHAPHLRQAGSQSQAAPQVAPQAPQSAQQAIAAKAATPVSLPQGQ